ALELERDNGYFIDSVGWALYQQGRCPEALHELQRAVEKAKEDPVIFDHLGDALMQNDPAEDAITAWQKSLSLDPTAEAVRKKIEAERNRPRRAKGESSKASQ